MSQQLPTATGGAVDQEVAVIAGSRPPEWRETLRKQALRNAMRKRAAGVPTYSVPEAAALLSVSQEYLYRLIQADGFPATLFMNFEAPISEWQLVVFTEKGAACIDVFRDILLFIPHDGLHTARNVVRSTSNVAPSTNPTGIPVA
jgi:hypothetical protein